MTRPPGPPCRKRPPRSSIAGRFMMGGAAAAVAWPGLAAGQEEEAAGGGGRGLVHRAPGEHHLSAVLLLERHHVEPGLAEARWGLLGGVAAHQTRQLRNLLAHQRSQVGVAGAQHELVLHLLLVVELLLQLQQPRVVEALLHLARPGLLLVPDLPLLLHMLLLLLLALRLLAPWALECLHRA